MVDLMNAVDIDRPAFGSLLALAMIMACTLALQVILTRLFSAVLAYHFSFLAISLALVGTGAGAIVVYIFPDWFRNGSTSRVLALWSNVFAALLLSVPFLLVQLDFSSNQGTSVFFVMNFLAACVLASMPPFASGIVVTVAIDRYRNDLSAVYAYDLVGAGLGALLVVPVLWLADAPTLIVALGIVVSIASILFAGNANRERGIAVILTVLGGCLIAIAMATQILYLDPNYNIPKNAQKISERWSPLHRAIGYQRPVDSIFSILFYDRVYAPVPMVDGGQLPDWKDVGTGPASIGYEMTGPGHALIIGGGGGRDIYTALTSKQWPVDVIELSKGNVRIVDEDLGHVSGKPYSRDGVSTTIGDGRSILANRETKYDQIHIGFTDTLSANAAQGFALTENNLYTIEAFIEYFKHLKPYGILNVSRLLKLVGDEALRVTVLTLAALKEFGVEDPFKSVVVVLGKDILGPPTGTVLARIEPFTEDELEKIRQLAQDRGKGLLLVPGGPHADEWKQLVEASSLDLFCTTYHLDVCPPTDNKPFFFSMQRLSQMGKTYSGYHYATNPLRILMFTLLILFILSFFAFVLPLFFAQYSERPAVFDLTYFLAIGLGFLIFEIVLIQRFVLFLGFPTYSLSVVIFALLVFTGVGSYLTNRIRRVQQMLTVDLAITAGIIGASAFFLQPLLKYLIDLPFAARVMISIALLAPFGVALGMAMPIGLKRFSDLYPSGLPYAWGVNGIASVFASVFGMAVAINLGFRVATMLACVCYLFAFMHALIGRWAEE